MRKKIDQTHRLTNGYRLRSPHPEPAQRMLTVLKASRPALKQSTRASELYCKNAYRFGPAPGRQFATYKSLSGHVLPDRPALEEYLKRLWL